MLQLITEIIEQFGGRPSGSQQERDAQHFIKAKMETFCDTVQLHPFKAAMNGHFGSNKFFVPLLWVSLGLYWVSIPAATVLSVLTVVFFFGHFVTYGDWLDFLFKKTESQNVIGTIEPQGEVKSTVLIAGHMDSVYEFRWWYILKKLGGVLTVVACMVFPLTMFFYLTLTICAYLGCSPEDPETIWWILVALAPTQIILITMHGDTAVDGATDNLSGIAISMGTAQHFLSIEKGESTLQNTRLKVVSFGCEEAGLKGSQAYVRDHLAELKSENTMLLNIDSIKNREEMTILHAELNTLAFYKKDVIKRTEESFQACNIPYRKVALGVGASDASTFAWQGIPAICIISLPSSHLDPIYHTRLDNLENIDPSGMDEVKRALIHFIERWDKEQPTL